jgi:ribosomal protein S18 acetylase RimI-like enzyme
MQKLRVRAWSSGSLEKPYAAPLIAMLRTPERRRCRYPIENMDELGLRPATGADTSAVAEIWLAGWRDGHLGGVPDELLTARTPESFHRRSVDRVADTTIATVNGEIAGFTMVVENEVEQVYVAAQYRGTDVAPTLLLAAEQQIAGRGFREAWLAVVASNVRARAFYRRCGWIDSGPFVYNAATETGLIEVPAHRYTKTLSRGMGEESK